LLATLVPDAYEWTAMPLATKVELLAPFLDERLRRLWAASEAVTLGHGGVSQVSRETGLSRATIQAGIHELEAFRDDPDRELAPGRVRRSGAGRAPLTRSDPALLGVLERLIDPLTRGDRNSPLRWTCKSTAALAGELQGRGRRVSVRSVAGLLRGLGYRLGGMRGGRGDKGRGQRNAQLEYLNALVADFQERGWPVITVEVNRREWLGPPGGENGEGLAGWEAAGALAADPGAASADGHGWVDGDPSPFAVEWAVEAIRRWWRQTDPGASAGGAELLVAVDLGEGDCPRLWHAGLQGLADHLGRRVVVSHLPPATTRWNRGEQHIAVFHTTTRRPEHPLMRHEAVVNLLTPSPPAEDRSPAGAAAAGGDRPAPCADRAGHLRRWNWTLVPRG
jgi:hypothetical protein